MVPVVVPAERDQLVELARAPASALFGGPAPVAMFPDPQRRPRTEVAFAEFFLRLAQADGQVVETTPSLTSVSVWVPPGHTTPWWRLAQCAPALVGWLTTATLADARRAFQYFDRLEKRRVELMPGPHWSLDVLAVSPHRQRFGLGAVLLRHGLERADRQGLPAYVQTEVEANADFYAKFGFTLVEHVLHDAPLGVPEWRLVRPAASASRPTTTSPDRD